MNCSHLHADEKTACLNFLSSVIEFSNDASEENLATLRGLSQMIPPCLEAKTDKEVRALIGKLKELQENLAYDGQISILAHRILKFISLSHS